MNNVNVNISEGLNPQEQEIFGILEKVVQQYAPNTTLRSAGGWVRDKLLGIPSDDIDIMVDNMSGEEFAKLVTKSMSLEDPHVIRQNPDASKHVETAKAYIPLSNGETQEIDFAMARQEIYDDDSRIPEIKPATAQEDAIRRDLTINSLFYNINDKNVEDFTGKGIKDLITNTIRTPLDPNKTFSDDPLRMFRTIRFAAKYSGQIDPETFQALQNPELREKIKAKISKERIGTEFKKMLKNPNPDYAIELMKDSGLWQDIVNEALAGTKYEGKMAELDMEQNNPWHELSLWGHTFQTIKNLLANIPDMEGEQKVVMLLAALTHDLGKLHSEIQAESKTHPGRTSYHGHEKESEEIASHVLRYLRLEPLINQVAGLARYHMRPHRMTEEGGAKTLRRFIRQMGELSLNWVDVLNLSVADALSKDMNIDPEVVKKYQELEAKLNEALQTMKPLEQNKGITPVLNGNEVMQLLNIKPGPWMKDITEFIKDIMDENPEISKEEAAQKIQMQFEYLSQDEKIQRQAGNEETGFSYCPMHLFNQRREHLRECYKDERFYEVISVLKELKEDYENDEKITKLIAYYMFYLLTKNKERYRDNDLLDYLFLNTEKDFFFDGVLACFTMGILLNIETRTEDDMIKALAEKGKNLNPELFDKIMTTISKCDPYRKDLLGEVK